MKKEILPLYDLKAPFVAALNNYTGAAEILASSVSALLSTKTLKPEIASLLQESLARFRRASTGDQ